MGYGAAAAGQSSEVLANVNWSVEGTFTTDIGFFSSVTENSSSNSSSLLGGGGGAFNQSLATNSTDGLDGVGGLLLPLLPHDSTLIRVLKGIPMVLIMVSAVFGNMLVILAVFKVERLRIIANSFIVSLAFADLLVAILVMPFSASQELAGKWLFGKVMCDIFNANDVLFSTASLMHICCISMDRYIAIMDPYHYEAKMTKIRAGIMLLIVWGASGLISHIPIHLGWYTTAQQQRELQVNEDECTFVVNKVYAAISSSISFWIPSSIMVFTYVMIYREARRQEKQIHALTNMPCHSLDQMNKVGNGHSAGDRNGSSFNSVNQRLSQERRKMKREHKAAKTLGIIMGAFLFCWLPFFLWYVITTMCGDICYTPATIVSMLFWIGYFNSALNPLIYAFFNRDFRNAFKKLLTNQRCQRCCAGLCTGVRCGCSSPNFRWCSKRETGPETDALKSTFVTEMRQRSRASITTSERMTPSPNKHPPHYDSVD